MTVLAARDKPCRYGHPPQRSFWQVRPTKAGGQWICRECVAETTARHLETLKLADPEGLRSRLAARQRVRTMEERMNIVFEYGGECVCCGETDWRKMTIDHIGGDGHSHRKKEGSATFYVRLRKAGYPKDNYQLLCWSCNAVKYYFPQLPCCPQRERTLL